MKNDILRYNADDLSSKQQQSIVLMARGASISHTAKSLGVTEQTIYNWKSNKKFMVCLKDETRAYADESRLRLASLSLKAVEAYADLLSNDDPNIRFKTAKEILKGNGLDVLNEAVYSLRTLGLETPLSKEQEKKDNLGKMLSGL